MVKSKVKSKVSAPAAKAPAKAAARAKVHERIAKPTEAERIAKGRKLATHFLVQRDGMDEDTAAAVVESMDPEAINELIEEANTATMGRPAASDGPPAQPPAQGATQAPEPRPGQAEPPAGTTGEPATTAQEAPPETIDFQSVPALAGDGDLVALVYEAAEKGAARAKAEEEYKAAKAELFGKFKAAGVKLGQRVDVAGIMATPYQGKTVTLSKEKLLEKGVAPGVIKACYKETPFDDVRIVVPRGAGVGNG